jgi:hypothetical protein
MNSTLASLSERFALSNEWAPPELFTENVSVSGLQIGLAGLSTRHSSGCGALGSAAELDQIPLARAYYELIERTSIIEWLARPREGHRLLDAEHNEVGFLPALALDEPNLDPERQRASLSNGVAAHGRFDHACRAAACELIERDRVLRSWYGQIRPHRVSFLPSFAGALESEYRLETYTFGTGSVSVSSGGSHRIDVAAAFGFPHHPQNPLLCGLGTGSHPVQAAASAWRECLQRLGFLWGEALPDAPDMTPTPDFHQDYYLRPENHAYLRSWLDGEHSGNVTLLQQELPAEIAFIDLTPPHLAGRLVVVKAVCAQACPLVFGLGHPWLLQEPPAGLEVHPIA